MQTSLEVNLPPETARLPFILDGERYTVRCAIHENHAEAERADMLFLELFSDRKQAGLASSPVRVVHMRWPMLLVHAIAKLTGEGTATYNGPDVTIDGRAFSPSAIQLVRHPQGARADAVALELVGSSELVITRGVTARIVASFRLWKILLNEAEAIA